MEPAASETRDLFHEHATAVFRFALVLVRSRQDAEDVLQETFLKLLQHLRSGGNADNLRGWLFTVAAHAARDRQRRRLRWLPWTVKTEPSVGPPALRDEDGRYRALREALRGLSERDRLLLALRAQGLSYREIAQAAGIKNASVGQFLARATERWSRATSLKRGAGAAACDEKQTGDQYESSYERASSSRR